MQRVLVDEKRWISKRPIVIVGAGLVGWGCARMLPSWTALPLEREGDHDAPPLVGGDRLHHDQPTVRRATLILLVSIVVWVTPILAAAILIAPDSILVDQGLFISGTALISFGGAYAALAYVAQQAVHAYGRLYPAEMVRGPGAR